MVVRKKQTNISRKKKLTLALKHISCIWRSTQLDWLNYFYGFLFEMSINFLIILSYEHETLVKSFVGCCTWRLLYLYLLKLKTIETKLSRSCFLDSPAIEREENNWHNSDNNPLLQLLIYATSTIKLQNITKLCRLKVQNADIVFLTVF